jgi:hypothetical protein
LHCRFSCLKLLIESLVLLQKPEDDTGSNKHQDAEHNGKANCGILVYRVVRGGKGRLGHNLSLCCVVRDYTRLGRNLEGLVSATAAEVVVAATVFPVRAWSDLNSVIGGATVSFIDAHVDASRTIPVLVRAIASEQNTAIQTKTGGCAKVALVGIAIEAAAARVNAVLSDPELVARHICDIVGECLPIRSVALDLVCSNLGDESQARGVGDDGDEHCYSGYAR